jgi:hypothetical protein
MNNVRLMKSGKARSDWGTSTLQSTVPPALGMRANEPHHSSPYINPINISPQADRDQQALSNFLLPGLFSWARRWARTPAP